MLIVDQTDNNRIVVRVGQTFRTQELQDAFFAQLDKRLKSFNVEPVLYVDPNGDVVLDFQRIKISRAPRGRGGVRRLPVVNT